MEDYKKKYGEALERAKEVHRNEDDKVSTMKFIFPELKESDDERIRKMLIKFFESCDNLEWYDGLTPKKAVAWLEKQGEIDKESYEIAEKEKCEFVGDGFIKRYADFQDFKEGETYWLEYVGNDNFNVRSDNLLGKTYHITPCQLYTIFKKMTWLEKKVKNKDLPNVADRETLDEYAYQVAYDLSNDWMKETPTWDDVETACKLGANWHKKQGEQKPTLPKWKYKKDNTPLLRDSLILNKYGCVARSPADALVSDVWVIDYDELAKLPKEEYETKGEQKPVYKIEPKFKVGDWVVWDKKVICHIDNIYQGRQSWMYTITDTNNMIRSYSVKSFDNNSHLWTIQDAKDGDVLYSPCCELLFIFKNDKECYVGNNLNYYTESVVVNSPICIPSDSIPATKEQRDLLFQKMKEAGYEWDADKKELRKLANSAQTCKDCKELTEFEKAFDRLSYCYGQEPDYSNEGTIRDCKKYAQQLLPIARRQIVDEIDLDTMCNEVMRKNGRSYASAYKRGVVDVLEKIMTDY